MIALSWLFTIILRATEIVEAAFLAGYTVSSFWFRHYWLMGMVVRAARWFFRSRTDK